MFSNKFPQQFLYLLIIFLLLLLVGVLQVVRPVKSFMEKILVIPAKEQVFQIKRIFKKDLGSCILTNEKQVAELKVQIASLLEENKEQKRLLSAPLPKNWQFLSAKVINVQSEAITINLGKTDGITEGMAVLSGDTYIGKVSKVSEKISEVRLLSFFDEKAVVKIISEETREITGKGLVIGGGEGKIKVEQILSPEIVKRGNLVIITVESGDLLVGQVEDVSENKNESFKTATVKRLYNPEDLKTVFVLKGKL